MKNDVTGALLAGGESRRFGRDKSLADWNGRPLIEQAATALAATCGHVILLANAPEPYSFLGLEHTPDLRPGKGPLAGLEAALAAAATPWVLLAACDMPCLSVRLLRHLIRVKNGFRAVIPEGPQGPEPLCAIYHRSMLAEVRAMLDRNDLAIRRLATLAGVQTIPAAEVADIDPDPLIFANVNRPEELERLLRPEGTAPRGRT